MTFTPLFLAPVIPPGLVTFLPFLLIIAVILQTGATSAVKAVKMSAKIVAGSTPEEADAEVFGTS